MSLSIIFAGTPDFAVPSLKALTSDSAFDLQLVITQPDRPVGKKKILTPPPVKVAAEALGIPVWQPESLNRELSTVHCPLSTRPDFLVVVAYGQILSKEVLAWPAIHPINVHASLLPRWRGASPIQHAILAGNRETGVTIQVMDEELDAGPILAQEAVPITQRDTATDLFDRLSTLGAALLVRILKSLPLPLPQPSEGITLCRKLSRRDGIVDPSSMTALEIDRKVRGLHPWPGVRMMVDGSTIKILRAGLAPSADSFPLHCTGGTTLHLLEVQPAGKKPMSGAAWKRGHKE